MVLRSRYNAGLLRVLKMAILMGGTVLEIHDPNTVQDHEDGVLTSTAKEEPSLLYTVSGSIQDANYISSHTPAGERSPTSGGSFDIDYPFICFIPLKLADGSPIEMSIDYLVKDSKGNVYRQLKDPDNVQNLDIYWLLSLAEPHVRA